MPARDTYHQTLKNALIKDHWQITHDPLRLRWGRKDMYVDLGAENLLTAEKAEQKIAVEIKTFRGLSEVNDIENAIGQYFVYHAVMAKVDPDRKLYLAVHQEIYREIFEEPLGQLLMDNYHIPLIVFDVPTETILKWIT